MQDKEPETSLTITKVHRRQEMSVSNTTPVAKRRSSLLVTLTDLLKVNKESPSLTHTHTHTYIFSHANTQNSKMIL